MATLTYNGTSYDLTGLGDDYISALLDITLDIARSRTPVWFPLPGVDGTVSHLLIAPGIPVTVTTGEGFQYDRYAANRLLDQPDRDSGGATILRLVPPA